MFLINMNLICCPVQLFNSSNVSKGQGIIRLWSIQLDRISADDRTGLKLGVLCTSKKGKYICPGGFRGCEAGHFFH